MNVRRDACCRLRLCQSTPLLSGNILDDAAIHCTTLQGTARHHPARHRKALQRTAAHCNALQRTASYCNALQRTASHCIAPAAEYGCVKHADICQLSPFCNTLQRTATHCNTLQRTATQRCMSIISLLELLGGGGCDII